MLNELSKLNSYGLELFGIYWVIIFANKCTKITVYLLALSLEQLNKKVCPGLYNSRPFESKNKINKNMKRASLDHYKRKLS